LVFAAGMLAITLVLAIFLYAVVETPCRRWAERWLALAAPAPNTPELTLKG
jgi:peptidoglycan/LPS O-acetylase OafA/YrhL